MRTLQIVGMIAAIILVAIGILVEAAILEHFIVKYW